MIARRTSNIRAVSDLPCLRELAGRVLAEAARRGRQSVLLVTSVERGDGKTTVACNLACLLAREGRKTVFVSGDGRALDAVQPAPASDLGRLIAREDFPEFAGGRPVAVRMQDPCAPELFRNGGPATWMYDFDILIIDAPELGHALTQCLVAGASGVLLVADMERSNLRPLVASQARIHELGGTLLGVVLNRHRSPVPRFLNKWSRHA